MAEEDVKKTEWKCDICGKADFVSYNQYRGHRGSCLRDQKRMEKARKTLKIEDTNLERADRW